VTKATVRTITFRRIFVAWAWVITIILPPQILYAKPQIQGPGTYTGKSTVNIIHNKQTLTDFYRKLFILEHGESQVVSILHIGDSHVQAGFLTKTIRDGLQQAFGNAGRGLVFPYAVARTNGPLDVKSQSNVHWKAQFSPSMVRIRPTGVMGISITSEQPDGAIDLWLVPKDSSDGAFIKATVFHDHKEDAFRIFLINSNNSSIVHSIGEDSSYSSSFDISSSNSIRLVMTKTDESERYATIYGISLENGRRGVLYHDAGVNGRSYTSLNGSVYLGPHLSILKPDLVIISLGTNDVNQKDFDPTTLRSEIEKTFVTIKNTLPHTAILVATPGDFGKSRNKLVKERLHEARRILIQLCEDHQVAYWDFNRVMGGPYSIDTWQRRGLVQADMVHLNRSGYQAQGELFLSAFLNGYMEYQRRVK
jgi:lysophospholipase L1-like esterase